MDAKQMAALYAPPQVRVDAKVPRVIDRRDRPQALTR